jgi:uncharacterized protein (TIGR02246 family)
MAMRSLLALSILVAGVTGANPAPARNVGDEAAVRAVFDMFQNGWNTPGFPNLEVLLAPDADVVVVTGKWLKGRDAIVAYHRHLLTSFYAGSRLIVDNIPVRFSDDRHAIAHFASTVQYTEDGQTTRRPSLATVTLVKPQSTWLIETFHNTITGGPGYMFSSPPSLPSTK